MMLPTTLTFVQSEAPTLWCLRMVTQVLVNYSYGVLGLGWRYIYLLIPRLASTPVGALSLACYFAAAGFVYKSFQDKDKAA